MTSYPVRLIKMTVCMCQFWWFWVEVIVCVIFGPFSNVDNFRLEVYSDVISGVIVDSAGVKVLVKFGDSRSNRSRDMRLDSYDNDNNDNDAGRRILWYHPAAFCLIMIKINIRDGRNSSSRENRNETTEAFVSLDSSNFPLFIIIYLIVILTIKMIPWFLKSIHK